MNDLDLKSIGIPCIIYHKGKERIMTVSWRRSAQMGLEIFQAKYLSARRICVYRRILLPTFHECHDLLTQVSLKVFEIIRRPSCGCPVTIHEAVTAVRQKIKPERNLRPSWWPTKTTRRDKQSADVRARYTARIYISTGYPEPTGCVFLKGIRFLEISGINFNRIKKSCNHYIIMNNPIISR